MDSSMESKAMVELADGKATPDKKTHLLSKDDYDNTKQVISVLVELLETFGFNQQEAQYKPSDAVKVWAPHVSEVGWQKWAKYKIAAYFAYHNGQPLPKQPTALPDNAGDLLTGKACRFMRNYLRRWSGDSSEERLERASFLTSVLQSKKGMPRPSAADLEKAAKETYSNLTTYTPPRRYAEVEGKVLACNKNGQERQVDFGLIVEEVRRTATELFRGKKFDPSENIRSVMPSLSANYNRTRSKLGTLGMLASEGDLEEGLPEEMQFPPTFDINYHHMDDYEPDLAVGLTDNGEPTVSVKTSSSKMPGWRLKPSGEREGRSGSPSAPHFMTAVCTSMPQLRSRFNDVFYRCLRKAQEEEPLVDLVALPEALKVRVISKGPPYTYFVLKQMQKFMWNTLKDHPVFALIGQTVNAELLNSMIGSELSEGLAYLSGDYKAATDNLRGELSEAAWLAICELCDVPNALAVLGLRALTGHTVTDPSDPTGVTVLSQQAGQLMGSIISFPILCIVNAAVCRLSLEIDHCKQLSLGRRKKGGIWINVPRLLINGDDCLFVVTERGRKVWAAVSSLAGLEESIGKVYHSRDFANVNSTNFLRIESQNRLVQVPYVNLGLLFGYKRSGGQASVTEVDFDLASRQTQLFRLSGDIRNEVLWEKFKKHNAESLETYSRLRIPWFVPKVYGGVGLEPVGSSRMTREDGMICRAMIQRTLPHAPRPRILKDQLQLQIHRDVASIVEESIGYRPKVTYSLQKTQDQYDIEGLYLYYVFCMPTLMARNSNLIRGIDQDPAEYVHELLVHNSRVWGHYWKRLGQLPPPFPEGLQERFPTHDVVLVAK